MSSQARFRPSYLRSIQKGKTNHIIRKGSCLIYIYIYMYLGCPSAENKYRSWATQLLRPTRLNGLMITVTDGIFGSKGMYLRWVRTSCMTLSTKHLVSQEVWYHSAYYAHARYLASAIVTTLNPLVVPGFIGRRGDVEAASQPQLLLSCFWHTLAALIISKNGKSNQSLVFMSFNRKAQRITSVMYFEVSCHSCWRIFKTL